MSPQPDHTLLLSDAELVAQFKATGENSCFATLYKRYTHLVYGSCLKYLKNEEESRDAVMQIFEKLLSDLRKHEITHFKSWLYIFTKNHCLMMLRKQNTFATEHIESINNSVALMENPELMHHNNGTDKEVTFVKLENAIEKLGDEQQICIRLFYLEKKSYHEVAEATGYDMNKVKSNIQNGKRNLKIMMTANDE